MLLVRSDLARDCIAIVRIADEWPQYAKLVYVASLDLAVVAPSEWHWHVGLLDMIAAYIEEHLAARHEFTDADVFFGFVEWEDNGAVRIRTTSGPRDEQLPSAVEDELLAELLKFSHE